MFYKTSICLSASDGSVILHYSSEVVSSMKHLGLLLSVHEGPTSFVLETAAGFPSNL